MPDEFAEIRDIRERFLRAVYDLRDRRQLDAVRDEDIMHVLGLEPDITTDTGMRARDQYRSLAHYWEQLGYIEYFTDRSIRLTARGIQHVEGDLERQAPTSVTFNIGRADRSIIGTQTHAQLEANINFENLEVEIEQRGGADKEALRKALRRIEELLENRDSISRGELAEFSEVMERHSWFTGAMAQALIGFATQALGGALGS